jgi:hypothetical protein
VPLSRADRAAWGPLSGLCQQSGSAHPLIPTHPPHFDHARRLLSSYKKINPVDAELFFVFTEHNHPQGFIISGFNSSHRFKFDNESKRGAACSCDIVKGEAMEAV